MIEVAPPGITRVAVGLSGTLVVETGVKLAREATGPYKPGTWQYNPNVHQYPYDPAKARALLTEGARRIVAIEHEQPTVPRREAQYDAVGEASVRGNNRGHEATQPARGE